MRIKDSIISFCLLVVLLFLPGVNHAQNCIKLLPKVKSASEMILGIDYPWWYNLGQLETESNCIWRTSLDGWGSIGYAQITPKWEGTMLNKIFPLWKKESTDHFLAHAYLVKKYIRMSKCNKLWTSYQCYNRNCQKINLESHPHCNWNLGYQICLEKHNKQVCVYKKNSECKQYRSSCEINYSYGFKVWKNGRKYAKGIIENLWRYW